jgi:fumarate reductase (CoM/CoB) subunit A
MSVAIEQLVADVVVVGGGVAALRAAVAACEAGADVVLCCKGQAGRSGNTVVSTADISAYIPELGIDDSEAIFAGDTLSSGSSIADENLVRLLAELSGPALLDLERLGILLLKDGDPPRVDRTKAAGHTRARTYRADSRGLGPNKGLALSVPLAERARALGVRCLDRTPVVAMATDERRAVGVVAVDLADDNVYAISTPAVVVAAGGASHLYARTNGTADATGDAIALALWAGASARDLEFVQWHPTRMDEPVPLFLTNGLLADGAVFRAADGREFMEDYDPRGSLAPRDVLAKAVYTEAQSGRGVGDGVYLDCSAVPPDRIALRHGYLAETLQKHGIDFPRQWLVVSPATHFLMGGIAIDATAASSLPGIFVAGESAGGIHGANRLGGNAFCEGLVFGTIAGTSAAAQTHSASNGLSATAESTLREAAGEFLRTVDATAGDVRPVLSSLWQRLRHTMWQHASLVRDAGGLSTAGGVVDELAEEAAGLRGRTPAHAARIAELRAGLACARAIVAAAMFREESRGAHWRADFPETSEAWFGSTFVHWPNGQASPRLEFRPKVSSRLKVQA